jgi:hypothetical protein
MQHVSRSWKNGVLYDGWDNQQNDASKQENIFGMIHGTASDNWRAGMGESRSNVSGRQEGWIEIAPANR